MVRFHIDIRLADPGYLRLRRSGCAAGYRDFCAIYRADVGGRRRGDRRLDFDDSDERVDGSFSGRVDGDALVDSRIRIFRVLKDQIGVFGNSNVVASLLLFLFRQKRDSVLVPRHFRFRRTGSGARERQGVAPAHRRDERQSDGGGEGRSGVDGQLGAADIRLEVVTEKRGFTREDPRIARQRIGDDQMASFVFGGEEVFGGGMEFDSVSTPFYADLKDK